MAESTKVRLVRCPKCENLLPELEDYSVYQCGGCGAVLRAKHKNKEADSSPEKSEEERIEGASAKSHISPEKGTTELSDVSDPDKANAAGSLKHDHVDSEKSDVVFVDRRTNQSKFSSEKWVVENSVDENIVRDELAHSIGREHRVLNSQIGYAGGSQRSDRMSDWRTGERAEAVEGISRKGRDDVGGVRISTSDFPDEGPSNYHSHSSYGRKELLRNHVGTDGATRVPYLEQDRAELLRKLDELKEQLSRSCDVVDKPKEKVPQDVRIPPLDPYVGSDSWLSKGSSRSDRASMPFSGPDKHAAGPSYFNHRPDPFPYKNGHEMTMHGLLPSMHEPNYVPPPYGDPFGSQVLRRPPHQLSSQYQQPSHPYFSGQYINRNHDPIESYHQNATIHHPTCSCCYCYDKHQRVSAPVQPTAIGNKTNNSMLYHHENPGAFGPRFHNFGAAAPLNFQGPHTHTRWPSVLNSEMGGFVSCCPRRVVLTSSGRRCRPIVGGAPFIVCNNCFEVLQLPKKLKLMAKNQQKLQCGTCSTIINFSVIDKKLVLSVQAETKETSTEVDDGSNEVVKDYTSRSHGRLDRISANFSSDDYDNSGYDFQAMDRESVPLSNGQYLNSGKPQEMHSFHSSSSGTSEDEHSPDVIIAQREITNSINQAIKATLSPPPPGSPLQEHFDYSSTNHAVNRFGKGNRSNRSDQEKLPNKVTTRQNSLKEATVATEMEVSLNDYSNADMSQDSGDTTREDDLPRSNKASESFFANIIKKSFKDFTKSNQAQERGKSYVSVNGHFIPDRLIKKAEKLAGPINHGQYWYDVRAGFWGVMGGPCLGIIPPFIEELNYPISENCAGGDTGVFVNGRELHQKDLDLLASRGLPTTRDRSYIIELSGRIFDEDTGEELDGLGKLAPTVEKVKHGFGMKPPRVAA